MMIRRLSRIAVVGLVPLRLLASDPAPLPKNRGTDAYPSFKEYLEAAARFETQRLASPGWSQSGEADLFARAEVEVAVDAGTRLRFIKVPAGEFVDAFPADAKRAILETPSRNRDLRRWERMMETERRGTVRVPYGYFMSETIVTNAMFQAFVRATGYRTTVSRYRTGWIVTPEAHWLQGIANDFDQERHPFGEPEHPVVQISWFDAMQFARWVSEQVGAVVRLPTFEEWTLAGSPATASSAPAVFPWGNTLEGIERRLNFGSAELDYMWVHDQYRDGHAFTSPVRAYPPNDRGLRDAVGNVWVWSFTPRDTFAKRADGDRTALPPRWSELGVERNLPMAMHGGCYLARLTHVTLFAAMSHPALDGAEDIGFRLVIVPAAQAGVPLRDGR